jgi:hypothetical protein
MPALAVYFTVFRCISASLIHPFHTLDPLKAAGNASTEEGLDEHEKARALSVSERELLRAFPEKGKAILAVAGDLAFLGSESQNRRPQKGAAENPRA